MKVLLLPYAPISNASARYRIYKLVPYLEQEGHLCKIQSPMSDKLFRLFYKILNGGARNVIAAELHACLRLSILWLVVCPRRLWSIWRWGKWCDVAVVQREMFMPGITFPEKALRKRVRKFIWDYDDALYSATWSRGTRHVDTVISIADSVIAGNDLLAGYSVSKGKHTIVMPTCVDFERYTAKDYSEVSASVTIGWVGNPYNLRHISVALPALQYLSGKYPEVLIRIITDGQQIELPRVRVEFRKWALEKEIEDLREFDIAIMPLIDDEYTRGKCGFKLIQYMAIGLPTVSSPVGVNSRIVRHGENGLLAGDAEKWKTCLERLVVDRLCRANLGNAARRTIERDYSLSKNAKKVMDLLSGLAK